MAAKAEMFGSADSGRNPVSLESKRMSLLPYEKLLEVSHNGRLRVVSDSDRPSIARNGINPRSSVVPSKLTSASLTRWQVGPSQLH